MATVEANVSARRSASYFLANKRGTAAVEFALVLPVLLTVLIGIVAYSIYFGAAHSTAQIAADAARASVAGLSDAERSSLALQQVKATAASYPLLKPAGLSASATPLPDDPTSFQVTVAYDARDLPIWGAATFLPLPAQTITRTAVIKRGGY